MRQSRKTPPRGAVPRKARRQKASLSQRIPRIAWRQWRQSMVQRWRHGVALLVLGGAIWALVLIPSWLSHFPLQVVSVEGVEDERRQQEVEVAIGNLVRGKNYFNAPLSNIHKKLDQLGWVNGVMVRRQWPDTLELTFTERKPMAVWNDEWLVGEDGQSFAGLDKFNVSQLPHLYGPAERLEDVLAYYHSMNEVLGLAELSIKKMQVDARLTAEVTINNGTEVVVDRHLYSSKLERFVNLYQRRFVNEDQPMQRVDLRYADGMAVIWGDAPNTTNKRGS